MARLYQCGFELQSTTTGVEFDSVTGAGATISTTTVHGGLAALRCNPSASTAFMQYTFQADTVNTNYHRFYLNIHTAPAATIKIWEYLDSGLVNVGFSLNLTSAGILQMVNDINTTAVLGSSTGLRFDTWHLIELKIVDSATTTAQMELRVDGGVVASLTGLTGMSGAGVIRMGAVTGTSSPDLFFDDLAINDTTGSNQNAYPGPGSIVHLKPNAAGDINTFNVAVGGTAGAANNFTRVQEVTPDDATSYNAAALLNAEDLFNCDNFTGGAFGVISVVAVGARLADLVAGDATTGVKLELEKISGGTKSQSANLIPNSTSFTTNKTATPRSYQLVTYANPDGGEWTQSYLDSLQVGYINDTVGVQSVAISTIWVSVDFSPPPSGTTTSVSSTSSTSSSISTTSSSTSSTSTSSTSQSTSSTSSSISTSSTSSSTSSTSSSISSTSSSSTSASASTSSTSSSMSSTSFSSTSLSSTSSSSSMSSTSSSISSTSNSTSSTSHSTSSTSQSSTSSSSSTSSTAIPVNLIYTYQDTLTLPTTGANDIDVDTSRNVMNQSVDDGDYFIQYGSEYMVQEYKNKHPNNSDAITFIWKGRSTESTVVSPFFIQIYNVNSAQWETLSRETRVPADTDFTVRVSQSINVSNYYDASNIVTFRSYQQVI